MTSTTSIAICTCVTQFKDEDICTPELAVKIHELYDRWLMQTRIAASSFQANMFPVYQGCTTIKPSDAPTDFGDSFAHNRGFAEGMNRAIENARLAGPFDFYRVVGIDIGQPADWLRILVERAVTSSFLGVWCPGTNYTKNRFQQFVGPSEAPDSDEVMCPAIAWLIPGQILKAVCKEYGDLFPMNIGKAWGEDDLAAARIRHVTGQDRPFMVHPPSWIHHDGECTSRHIPEEDRFRSMKAAEQRIRRKEL